MEQPYVGDAVDSLSIRVRQVANLLAACESSSVHLVMLRQRFQRFVKEGHEYLESVERMVGSHPDWRKSR